MKHDVTELSVDDVVIKRVFRENYGDLQSLALSIQKIGLIDPLLVDRDNVLICGSRRLEACREVGMKTVPVIRLDIAYTDPEALEIQADGNLCRLPLSSSELEGIIKWKKELAEGAHPHGLVSGLRKIFSHS